MVRRIVPKVLSVVATLVAVSFLTFLLTDLLPGDPAEQILGPQGATPEALAQVRSDLHLDDPLPQRYADWVRGAVSGDLGRSYRTGQPVWESIRERLPVTLEVGGLAILLALAGAVP